jgi:hypothetical protein
MAVMQAKLATSGCYHNFDDLASLMTAKCLLLVPADWHSMRPYFVGTVEHIVELQCLESTGKVVLACAEDSIAWRQKTWFEQSSECKRTGSHTTAPWDVPACRLMDTRNCQQYLVEFV